jgi:DNA mismatch endonuclease (patch repair protein)
MADRIASEARSLLMSRIKLRNTGPEIMLRRALWAAGLRYRLKLKVPLPGRPDIIFPRARLAVFVDGCFWHGCPLHGHLPKSHGEYWGPKLARTRRRDAEVTAGLQLMGWRVLRIWEHQIKADLVRCVVEIGLAVRRRVAY